MCSIGFMFLWSRPPWLCHHRRPVKTGVFTCYDGFAQAQLIALQNFSSLVTFSLFTNICSLSVFEMQAIPAFLQFDILFCFILK